MFLIFVSLHRRLSCSLRVKECVVPSTDGEGSLMIKRTPGRRVDKRVTNRGLKNP